MITSKIVVAYAQCKLKAYLLLCTNEKGISHQYFSILEENVVKSRTDYFRSTRMKMSEVMHYSSDRMKRGIFILTEANLEFEDLNVYADALIKVEEISSKKRHNYVPVLVVGTYKINKDQKLQLAFIGYVLSKLQKEKPAIGFLMEGGNKRHKTKLESLYKKVEHTLKKLRSWTFSQEQKAPSISLNQHCPYCPFQKKCETKAKEQEHLSLLKGISEKEIATQNKKGIFTVTQFSYTYRPRKRRKRKKSQSPKYSHSLRALAIRDEKIYVVENPEVPQSPTQIFLDVEGTPDQDFYYLIGILVIEGTSVKNFSFWADNRDEEEKIWTEFLSVIKTYSDYTLFHYGSYETKFIEKMSKKYGCDEDKEFVNVMKSKLLNILSLIYAKIYFPTYSNSLKEIGVYLGQKWTEKNATGLQSLVWRYKWEKTKDKDFKQKLLSYNYEDCVALQVVTHALESIAANDNTDSTTRDMVCVLPAIHMLDAWRKTMNTTPTTRRFSYSKIKGTLGYFQTRTVRYSCPRLSNFLCWGQQVLDVGCGPGGITADVATAIYPAGKATGVDVTEDAIEAAREFATNRHIENIDFQIADAYHLPFPDNSFDLTYAINTAIYLNIQSALREWCRVTTPHGWIFLNVLDLAESRMYWPPCPSVTKFYQQQRKDPHASLVGAALDGVGDAGLVDIQVMVEAPPEFTFFTGSSGLDFVNIAVKPELLHTEDPQLKQTAENALKELEAWNTHPHHLAVEIHTWIAGRIPQ